VQIVGYATDADGPKAVCRVPDLLYDPAAKGVPHRMARKTADRAAKVPKPIEAYYKTLKEFEHQYALHEGAVSTAFQTLLSETARKHKWTLIPQLGEKYAGKEVRPDGTLKDELHLVRGHWEAKDTSDDLDAEIGKKIKRNYPLKNIIFEDTRTAVLMQNKQQVMRVDLRNAEQLQALLDAFFGYTEPQIENFEHAVGEFQQRVPDLAKHLKEKIEEAHQGNKKFQAAFDSFFKLCQTALNPNISEKAVDEMLIQHLLTERLIREVFENPEFTRRNVIAAEVEKVIDALTSKAFNRDVFLKSLDRFYVAIENAARTMPEFSDKQHFLNTVYERFFQGYSVKLADTHGIVYTPQPIVDFMCASVAEVLEKEFGKTLGDKDVFILDPCTGTGNFIVNLVKRIPKRDLPRVYREQLFANEVMLLPYYIAALNIEHAYYEQTDEYEAFEGLCFVDTLDIAEHNQAGLDFFSAKNAERVDRQRSSPITVVIGNPPYNMGQVSENDNNKNRKYPTVDERIRHTYVRDSRATLRRQLYDPYVRFFRWATDRLEGRDGIICYVSNNSFLDQYAFDAMRRELSADFSAIYHVDLKGNVRQNPKLSGSMYNAFGIQVGVGITCAVRRTTRGPACISYAEVPEDWRKEVKLKWLRERGSVGQMNWERLQPDRQHNWFVAEGTSAFATFLPVAGKAAQLRAAGSPKTIFSTISCGIMSGRDDVVYDFRPDILLRRIETFSDRYNAELDRFRRKDTVPDLDSFLDYAHVKWSRNLKRCLRQGESITFTPEALRPAIYRPFTKRHVYFQSVIIDEQGQLPKIFPNRTAEAENRALWVKTGSEWPMFVLAAGNLVDLLPQGGSRVLPFHVYDEDGTNRRENITDWALSHFRAHYGDDTISKWDIFHYVYGVLHHGGYRAKFADNLKRELPRIPLAPDFTAFRDAGRELARLHLDYENLEPWPLKWVETPGEPLSYRVEKMRLTKDKSAVVVNESLTLEGVPPEAFEYRLGNRSALEWVIDQYQVSTDKRSGITSDPNRPDDEQYIVRLVGQVVRVSVETVKIVNGLPVDFGTTGGDGAPSHS
jgi:predicted helicase